MSRKASYTSSSRPHSCGPEQRYRARRGALPTALAGALPAARPNILFVMVDSLSKGLAYSGLPETIKLLRDLSPRDADAAGRSEEKEEEGGGMGGGGGASGG